MNNRTAFIWNCLGAPEPRSRGQRSDFSWKDDSLQPCYFTLVQQNMNWHPPSSKGILINCLQPFHGRLKGERQMTPKEALFTSSYLIDSPPTCFRYTISFLIKKEWLVFPPLPFLSQKRGSNFRVLTRGREKESTQNGNSRQNPTSNLFPAARISWVPSGLNARS